MLQCGTLLPLGQHVGGVAAWELHRLQDPDVACADLSSFSLASGLRVIVTGLENSGTTIVSELIMLTPELFGGLECGLLLAPSPAHFRHVEPFQRWLSKQ